MGRRSLQILGYVIATIIVFGGTGLLIAYGNGYTYDLKTGQLVHRGLIILNSNPSGATIALNGKTLAKKTNFQQTYKAGFYNFTLSRDGYRTWSKRIEAVPSQATLVQYVLLLPQKLVTTPVITRSALAQFTASADRRHIAFVVPSGGDAGLWSVDPSNGHQTKLYASAAATDTASAEAISILGWATDASRVLIRSHTDSGTAFLVVSAGGSGQPVNLSTTFGITTGNLQFNPANAQQLYWTSPDGLRRIDLGAQTVSDVLVAHLGGYGFAGGRILYVDTTSGHTPSLWSLDSGGHTQKLVSSLPPSQSYAVAYATYIGTPEGVVVAQDSHTATLYRDVYNQPTSTNMSVSATQAVFNGDGRFVALSDDQDLATYDLQYNHISTFQAPNNEVTGLTWFDNFHLLFVRGGDVVLSEFDGNYATSLVRGDGQTPYGTSSGQFVTATSLTASGETAVKSVKIHQ